MSRLFYSTSQDDGCSIRMLGDHSNQSRIRMTVTFERSLVFCFAGNCAGVSKRNCRRVDILCNCRRVDIPFERWTRSENGFAVQDRLSEILIEKFI